MVSLLLAVVKRMMTSSVTSRISRCCPLGRSFASTPITIVVSEGLFSFLFLRMGEGGVFGRKRCTDYDVHIITSVIRDAFEFHLNNPMNVPIYYDSPS